MRRVLCAIAMALLLQQQAYAQEVCAWPDDKIFMIELFRLGTDTVTDRDGKKKGRVFGDIAVNGQNIGRFYENPDVMIAAGTYKGNMRYESDHNFVQSSCGEMAQKGDFLIEVTGVKNENGTPRSNLLFHPGFLPSHSQGCVLFGARKKGEPLPENSPLVRLRREFYGTDNPVQCPNKQIVIKIGGNP